MICNNVGIKVNLALHNHICMVHSITQRAFFLNGLMGLVFRKPIRIMCRRHRKFMLMRVYYVLSRYKTDQYHPRIKNI